MKVKLLLLLMPMVSSTLLKSVDLHGTKRSYERAFQQDRAVDPTNQQKDAPLSKNSKIGISEEKNNEKLLSEYGEVALFLCKLCDTFFSLKAELEIHNACVHGDCQIRCVCGSICADLENFYGHQKATRSNTCYQTPTMILPEKVRNSSDNVQQPQGCNATVIGSHENQINEQSNATNYDEWIDSLFEDNSDDYYDDSIEDVQRLMIAVTNHDDFATSSAVINNFKG